MKKIKVLFILLLIMTTTGCLLGEEGKGYLTRICTLSKELDGVLEKQEYAITHLGNEIQKIVLTNEYTMVSNETLFSGLKDADASMQISLKNEVGVEITQEVNDKNQYRTIYTFNYLTISESLKTIYGWNNKYDRLIKEFEAKGYICK